MNLQDILVDVAELDPIAFVRTHFGFHPDPAQARVLSGAIRRGLLNCCRQWGKSTTTAAAAVYHAYTNPESLSLVVSPSARQSGEFLRKVKSFLHKLGIVPRGDGDNEMSVILPKNRSRIVGLPGKENTIRGFSRVSLLLIDEAARVPDELYFALRPALATSPDATIWLMSTPHGQDGFFYEEWANKKAAWERIRVPATECPRIRQDFLDEERRTLGDRWFAQEYLCKFMESESALFRTQDLEGLFSKDVRIVDLRIGGSLVITPDPNPGYDPYKPRYLNIY
ncbi:MAG: terminase family protein [Bryobacteraceae bacterium]